MSKQSMDDSALLTWLQNNAVSVNFQSPQGSCEITYGRGGAQAHITAPNLRDAVERAVAQQGGTMQGAGAATSR